VLSNIEVIKDQWKNAKSLWIKTRNTNR
jgi:hypothetical protein